MSRKNIARRKAGVAIGLLPVLLLVASIAAGFSGPQLRVSGGMGVIVGASIGQVPLEERIRRISMESAWPASVQGVDDLEPRVSTDHHRWDSTFA